MLQKISIPATSLSN